MNRCAISNNGICVALIGLCLFCWVFALPAHGQQDNSSASEVYLSFQYRGVVSVYVTAYYQNGQFYLPASELFNTLKIDHQVDQGAMSISGTYLGDTDFRLDFNNRTLAAGDQEIALQAGDYLIQEIDYFLRPELFEELLGLQFSTDFNNLTLDLQTEEKMPVVAQYEREKNREQLERNKPSYDRSFYPLQYDRKYHTADGAFLDYNFSAVYTQNAQLLTFSNAIGAEILGGDVQGNLFGSVSDQQSNFTTSGLRWRFVQRDREYFSSATAGQTNTEGISSRAITGVKISNKPVEPRLLFDRYAIEGNVTPQSEVELYLNNRLVDYQAADQSGNYRFLVPLTYGSTNYSVRAYTPSGQLVERNSRIQVPFDYLPPGEIDYSISGGRLNNPILGSTERGYMAEASVSTGLTNWLTAKTSSEYLTDYHNTIPSFTGTLNARLFSNYLLSANVNSENFYNLTSSVVYGSGASWSLAYDYNPGQSRLYSTGGTDHQARVNLFTPFNVGELPLNIRWSSTYQQRGTSQLLRYRADLNTRMGRLNMRLGYQDQQAGTLALETTSASRITNSYTYSMGRYQSMPDLLRGMFIRGQLSYLPGMNQLEEMEFQLSRDLMQTGRMQLTFGHNFIGRFNSLSLNFTFDLKNVRSNTTSRAVGSDLSVTQNFRGSIGYDHYGKQMMLNNRQQVGQAGTAVRLFVDNNNDGTYQADVDNVITDPAVRLNRAGGRTTVKNGINYISQLLPYYQYNVEINQAALKNPLLVPDVANFSLVTDPNQYKTIEIPFYLSGVISGMVERQQNGTVDGLSGVRLYLESQDSTSAGEPYSKELRTFSDGSFYMHEVPPGNYNLFIDPNQLEFLNVNSQPDTMQFKVQALAEGDFVENLNFLVKSNVVPEPDKPIAKKKEEEQDPNFYQVQVASYYSLKQANSFAKASEKLFGEPFNVVYNASIDLYGVRTETKEDRNQTVETVISFNQNNSYPDAALVILEYESKDSAVNEGKVIHLGAFSHKEKAQDFAARSAAELSQEVSLSLDEEIDLYKVYVTNAKPATADYLHQLLTDISAIPLFNDAYIGKLTRTPQRRMNLTYQIELDGVSPDKKEILNQTLDGLNIQLNYSENNKVIINKLSTWRKAIKVHTQLKNLDLHAHPVLILRER